MANELSYKYENLRCDENLATLEKNRIVSKNASNKSQSMQKQKKPLTIQILKTEQPAFD